LNFHAEVRLGYLHGYGRRRRNADFTADFIRFFRQLAVNAKSDLRGHVSTVPQG
jgi:hypothetical protein